MVGSGSVSFTDPGDYRVGLNGASLNVVLTGRGDFRAHVTWVELRQMRLARIRETVSRIAFLSLAPELVFVTFPTHHDPPAIWSGVKLRLGDVVFHSLGDRMHQRMSGAGRWGLLSLSPETLAAYGRALLRVDLTPPSVAKILRPASVPLADLLRLHREACRLAETKPDLITHREVARAIEQDLLPPLITCLTADEVHSPTAARQRHAGVMARFEDVLASNSHEQPNMPELCAAVGVPERTLRMCCADFLGMSPSQYARLRRLTLVRAALRQAKPATTNIAEVARQYGFSELGRFAAAYRAAFGEAPSTTLRGHRLKVRDRASAECA
jgi:AraC-like DNA-binding protein